MINGLWIVQFHGPQGNGGGIVVLIDGRVYGGDSGFYYLGSYELKDASFKGRVMVKNFDPALPNVLGIVGDFELLLEGTVQGPSIVGTGALASAPNARIVVRLTKRSDLT
jgi:hypothetical protein